MLKLEDENELQLCSYLRKFELEAKAFNSICRTVTYVIDDIKRNERRHKMRSVMNLPISYFSVKNM